MLSLTNYLRLFKGTKKCKHIWKRLKLNYHMCEAKKNYASLRLVFVPGVLKGSVCGLKM